MDEEVPIDRLVVIPYLGLRYKMAGDLYRGRDAATLEARHHAHAQPQLVRRLEHVRLKLHVPRHGEGDVVKEARAKRREHMEAGGALRRGGGGRE